MERVGNRVCLNRVSEKAQSQRNQNREDSGQNLSEGSFKCRPNVVNRAAGYLSVMADGSVHLG